MKKFLASAAILAAFVQPAAASDDARIFGAVVGAVIGYHIMDSANRVEVQPQVVITAPQRHYRPETVIVVQQQPQRHYHVHPQTVRIYRDTCTAYGRGRHGNVICQ